ncbi:uncharacterized protein TRIADDRAFT_59065 [Trichoplax adhaerens]|uniref:Uncharacterized protein n=1 Tax=Trichoplax adhaerens TaxID=10228 RepID=B3S4F5_TRIAD|nr:hypothetical protein TRIADDRAFT_59065 [Trichoplax adhaerens]EDV22453.1 hypothetical protein TRIADDRAFT_59065 [Trichoplax adhaerens]|eukprot:XP_002114997.1 hypothetical protein TRIADDRAFT_59065 [Trichoplax adhaerens]
MMVFLWLLTGHWLVIDVIGMVLCTAVITYVRLPNLQVSTYLLCGLLIYDVFWVYFSERIFRSNVMIDVAMSTARNPVIPGLLTSFALRFDNFKSKQSDLLNKSRLMTVNYFRCCLIGYAFGLFLAGVFATILNAPQPALLFLVPSTLLPLWLLAYKKNDIGYMWSGSFNEIKIKREVNII